jgi:hypothetical protein
MVYTFDPSTLATTAIGGLDCLEEESATPWTLSVSRAGKAYVVYDDAAGTVWPVYEVDLTTFECRKTPLDVTRIGLSNEYGIAVSRTGGAEQLYVFGSTAPDGGSPVLGVADLTTFTLTEVGPAVPTPTDNTGLYDMQADLLGHLFVLTNDGVIEEIDAMTGHVAGVEETPFVNTGESWAIMTYQANVYLFADSMVASYDFASSQATMLGNVGGDFIVVGASAVPCEGKLH